MKNLLKYLIVAAFSLVLSGVADTDNTHLAFTVVTDVDGEYIQYQREQCAQYYHSVYEPDGEIYAVNSSNSINNTLNCYTNYQQTKIKQEKQKGRNMWQMVC